MFNFEKLEVWQKAIDFADLVYVDTRSFPNDERFGLTNQMRRAAVSISSNIAEGCSRGSKADFRRFIEIATGSASSWFRKHALPGNRACFRRPATIVFIRVPSKSCECY